MAKAKSYWRSRLEGLTNPPGELPEGRCLLRCCCGWCWCCLCCRWREAARRTKGRGAGRTAHLGRESTESGGDWEAWIPPSSEEETSLPETLVSAGAASGCSPLKELLGCSRAWMNCSKASVWCMGPIPCSALCLSFSSRSPWRCAGEGPHAQAPLGTAGPCSQPPAAAACDPRAATSGHRQERSPCCPGPQIKRAGEG